MSNRQVSKVPIFERYAGTVPRDIMSNREAASLGLPSEGDVRLDLIDSIRSLRKTSDRHRLGDPTKGFGFAIACLKIAKGEREPYIVTNGINEMIRPQILRRGTDDPLWKAFGLVFPSALRAQGFWGVDSVSSLGSIQKTGKPVELAMGYGKMIVAQSMEGAIERQPILEMYATNPAEHVVVTIEDVISTAVHPVLRDIVNPTATS